MLETLTETTATTAAVAPPRDERRTLPPRTPWPRTLRPWLQTQALNVTRHAAALRSFRSDEFGRGPAAPSEGHIQAVNRLMDTLRGELIKRTRHVRRLAVQAAREPATETLQQLVTRKERAHDWVRAIERIWDFYFELFGQRQSRFGEWLVSCDRIALDCYEHVYVNLGTAKSIPAPPPFSYMRTGFSPATFRRGIPLRRLGKRLNPFPLIQLPYHRLVNPWTLGAILHEVSHNLQNELGLARLIPGEMARTVIEAGCGRFVASVWARWNRELFADLSGLLLGGPSVVGSLMDVVGRSPATVFGYSPTGPHPTPYLRVFMSCELLRRMGFPDEAEHYRRIWTRIYPNPRVGNIPRQVLDTFEEVNRRIIDTICFRRYRTLGDKSLAEVIRFGPKEQKLVEEAARRLASGTDPGVVPERFLIGASRFALSRQLARPGQIAKNFYTELARR